MPTPLDQEIAILLLVALCGWPWIHLALAYHAIKTRN